MCRSKSPLPGKQDYYVIHLLQTEKIPGHNVRGNESAITAPAPLKDSSHRQHRTIRHRGRICNSCPFIACVKQRIISRIYPYMSAVADNIAGTDIGEAYLISRAALRRGVARQTDAERRINTHDNPGTVRTVCQAGPAVHIRISDKLFRIIHHGLSVGGTCMGRPAAGTAGTSSRASRICRAGGTASSA